MLGRIPCFFAFKKYLLRLFASEKVQAYTHYMLEIEHIFGAVASAAEEPALSKVSVVTFSDVNTHVSADSEDYAEERFVDMLSEIREMKNIVEGLSLAIDSLETKLAIYENSNSMSYGTLSEVQIDSLQSDLATLKADIQQLYYLLELMESHITDGTLSKAELGEVLKWYDSNSVERLQKLLRSYEREYSEIEETMTEATRREV